MKVGLAQIDCKLGDVKANLKKLREFISEAKEKKVNLLVFPELSLTGYVIFINRVGSEEGNNFWGGSSIIDPAGKEVVKADYYREDLVVGAVDREKIRIINLPYLCFARSDLT